MKSDFLQNPGQNHRSMMELSSALDRIESDEFFVSGKVCNATAEDVKDFYIFQKSTKIAKFRKSPSCSLQFVNKTDVADVA